MGFKLHVAVYDTLEKDFFRISLSKIQPRLNNKLTKTPYFFFESKSRPNVFSMMRYISDA